MATSTTNLHLSKQALTEHASLPLLNDNWDIIDNAYGNLSSSIAANNVLVVNCGTVTALPKSVSNAGITADMVAVGATLGTPASQTSNWTVTTGSGTVSISGTISGSTTLVLYLAKSRS